jgi:hypothetical protein
MKIQAWHSIEYSFGRSFTIKLRGLGVIAHHGNEQVGDAGCAYLP